MTKDEFIKMRTKIITKMLDNPDEHGIYPTTICFSELDDLYDCLVLKKSGAQLIRDSREPK